MKTWVICPTALLLIYRPDFTVLIQWLMEQFSSTVLKFAVTDVQLSQVGVCPLKSQGQKPSSQFTASKSAKTKLCNRLSQTVKSESKFCLE